MILLPYLYKSGKILLADLDPEHYITNQKAVIYKVSGSVWNTPIVPIYSNESLELTEDEYADRRADWVSYQEFLNKDTLEKHMAGKHDQSSHGRKGPKMGQGVAASILQRVKDGGGLSVKMIDGSEPTAGYMVAKGPKYGAIATATDFYDPIKGPKILADYMKANKADLATGKDYLGLWHNEKDGNVYLDVSENVFDLEDAEQRATNRDQISIWDVANVKPIETGGTGNVG